MIKVEEGDCLDVMRSIGEGSIDAVVTDPPYGLSFMGNAWDHGVPGLPYWSEAIRVLRPGGYLLAFGGARTFHRLTVAIEDAGFEVRDCLSWLYGSGFPKSLDVSKAIDKMAGAEREVVGEKRHGIGSYGQGMSVEQGFRPYANGMPSENNGGIQAITAPATPEAERWAGWGTALKPAWEPIIVARKPLVGTVAANVLQHGTGALNIDGCRIEGEVPSKPQPQFNSPTGQVYGFQTGEGRNGQMSQATGRWPANVVLDEAAAAMLDAQSGERPVSGSAKNGRPAIGEYPVGMYSPGARQGALHNDTGGASRFFYCAKASRSERGSRNTHPTVKPIALMRWLVRLVTPPGGIVLDPFAGSGTTGIAADREGFDAVLIESDPRSVAIIRDRLRAEVPLLQGISG